MALQQMLSLLLQELSLLQQEYAQLMQNQTTAATPASTTQSLALSTSTQLTTSTSQQTSTLNQIAQAIPQVVQTSTPSTTQQCGITYPCSDTQAERQSQITLQPGQVVYGSLVQKTIPCANSGYNVWWQDSCHGGYGIYGSSTPEITYSYPGQRDSNNQLYVQSLGDNEGSRNLQDTVNQLLIQCLPSEILPATGTVTFSNNNGTLLLTVDPSVSYLFAHPMPGSYLPTDYPVPTTYPTTCRTIPGIKIQ